MPTGTRSMHRPCSTTLDLRPDGYFLVSAHREENVDAPDRLRLLVDCLERVAQEWKFPVLVSTHPRTRQRIESAGLSTRGDIRFHEPFGFLDYNRLQLGARCVLSDSGTVSEESSILGFPAITLRESIERPEALDTGTIVMTGLSRTDVIAAIELQVGRRSEPRALPAGYEIADSSARAVGFILSTVGRHRTWAGLR